MPNRLYATEAEARRRSELGFRAVPWDADRIPRDILDEHLPRDTTARLWTSRGCGHLYGRFTCTRRRDHPGTHRAGNGTRIVAEWHGPRCMLYRTNSEARREERRAVQQ